MKRHFHVLRGNRTFWEEALLKMLDEAVEQDVDEYLACNVQERSSSVNFTTLAFAFPAVDVDYACIFVMGRSTHSTAGIALLVSLSWWRHLLCAVQQSASGRGALPYES